MSNFSKLLLLAFITCFSLFWSKQSLAAYSDEGVAFYAQPSYFGFVAEGIAFYANTAQQSDNVPVYRFANTINGEHFYTASEAERTSILNNPQWGFISEGIAYYAYPTQVSDTAPVYRFANTLTSQHFWTASEEEKNSITQSPVYRFVCPTTSDHFFTASESEKTIVANTTQSGCLSEGIGFYAFNQQTSGTSPVYRFANTKIGGHLYTISEEEKTSILNNPDWGYRYEGIAFYAYATQKTGYYPVYRFASSTTGERFYTISETERNSLLTPLLGPEISVGLWGYSKSDIQSQAFQIDANKPYNIRDNGGNIIAQISGGTATKVTYDRDGKLKVYNSIADTYISTSVTFDATDGDNSSIIFDTHRPNTSYDHYRGKIKAQYYHGADIVGGNTGTTVQQVWIVNTLPLEQYIWGEGETTGTGPMEHTKVMTTMFRTYGFWYIKYANKYSAYGFKIRSDSGSQIYWGYDRETQYPNIKTAAQATRGIFATYNGDVALTPYSSWSDGRTRSYQERWGSTDFPWCKSVSDPYGKHPTMSTSELEAAGNHMVGLIANGSLHLASDDHKAYDWILKYYYTGIGLPTNY